VNQHGAHARKSKGRGRPSPAARVDDGATRRILDAALKAFSVNGFSGAAISDIASHHSVSPALVHYYFENKEDLWRSALEYGIGNVVQNLRDTMQDMQEVESVERLKFFIRRYIGILADHPEVFNVIIRESEIRSPRMAWLSKHYLTPLYSLVSNVVEKAQQDIKIKSDIPVYHLSQIIAGACWQFISGRHRMLETFGVDVLSKEERERHANAVIDILFNGMLVRPERK
jgi:TetR/AcrR family transcriptional regulator